MELVLMYNVHPYFFLKNVGKKLPKKHYTWQNTIKKNIK